MQHFYWHITCTYFICSVQIPVLSTKNDWKRSSAINVILWDETVWERRSENVNFLKHQAVMKSVMGATGSKSWWEVDRDGETDSHSGKSLERIL